MIHWWESLDFEELPLVSVITPSYNQGRFIRNTIESVISQDYPRIEYWIIDGGSKDETLGIIKEFEDWAKYVSEPDEGQADAINKGFRLSRGDILIIQNSDDYFCDGAISSAVKWLRDNPDVAVVYGEYYVVDENDNTIELDNIIDLNFKIDYLLSEKFSAFLSLENILGNNYQRYYRYPVRGIQVMAGLSVSF